MDPLILLLAILLVVLIFGGVGWYRR